MKNKIDINEWKEFKIGDLFDIHPTKAYKMNNSSLLAEDGINPIVVNSFYNNGIGGYTNYDCTEAGNMITFSDTTSADSIFYQKDNFVGYPHVQGMYPIGEYKDKWSEYTYLFFVTLFREKAINLNYDYVNKFTRESAKKIMIKLPVDNKDNPDWNYMEQYMKNLEEKVRKSLKGLNSYSNEISKVNINKWKKYKIGKLFDATNTGNVLSRDVIDGSGNIPYVTASGVNNGVVAHIDASKYQIIKGNCILVGGKTFTLTYQSNDFVSNDSHNFEMHLKNNIIGVYEYLFVISVLRKTFSNKYYWGDAVTKGKLLEEEISLPSTLENEPDWNYMKNYMMNSIKNLKNKINYLNAI